MTAFDTTGPSQSGAGHSRIPTVNLAPRVFHAYSRATQGASMFFDGNTYDHNRDSSRLGDQMAAVLDLMADGKPRTLAQIADLVGAPESSVSARLRDLRKERFGGHTVNRQHVQRGLFVYQLVLREEVSA